MITCVLVGGFIGKRGMSSEGQDWFDCPSIAFLITKEMDKRMYKAKTKKKKKKKKKKNLREQSAF
jgi:hypothetical protein